jgi:hypothetical protein
VLGSLSFKNGLYYNISIIMWLSIVATHSLFLSVALCGPFGSKAVNTLARRDTSSDGQADPLSTKCGKIVVAANQGMQEKI